MRKILLTGASGFVGRQILRTLREGEVCITVVLREHSAEANDHLMRGERVIYSPDIFSESSEWWARQLTGIDTVIHCAWFTEHESYLHSPFNLDCLIGSLRIAEGCVSANVKRFVGLGTCLEYLMTGGGLTVSTPLSPMSMYASSKAALFMTLKDFFNLNAISFAWCRLFYLYGEGENAKRLVPYLHREFERGNTVRLRSPNRVLDFLDVSIAGASISAVALTDRSGPVNICSGVPLTVLQLAEAIADVYDRRDLIETDCQETNPCEPLIVLGVPGPF